MIGYVVGRLKEENTKTRAYKIYFPETKQSWLMGVSELKKRYLDGTLPEIVGIKFSETANLNSIELTIIGVTGYYSTMRVDNVDGAGQPINKEHMIWNVVGVKEFDDARKFICVTSQCEEAIFNIEQIRELYDQMKINGVFFDKNSKIIRDNNEWKEVVTRLRLFYTLSY